MNSPSPATVGNLAPVVAEADRRGISFAVLTVKNVRAGEHFCSAGCGTVTEEDLLASVPPAVRFRALARSRRRFAQLKRALIRLESGCGELLKGLSGVLTLELAQAAMFRAATRILLARWKPQSILSTGDFWPVDYNLMTAAREGTIPTLILQHGMMAPFSWPFVADKLALWGPIFAREIEQLGAPSDRLVFAGMPITDTTFKERVAQWVCAISEILHDPADRKHAVPVASARDLRSLRQFSARGGAGPARYSLAGKTPSSRRRSILSREWSVAI